jgi:hypothetical protein
LAELFQTSQQNISLHFQNIYAEGELQRGATHKEFLSVRSEGGREVSRSLDSYNLDAIISVGHAFLTVNERAILENAGNISHGMARELAEAEYDKFNRRRIAAADAAGSDFDKAIQRLPPPPKRKKGGKK